MTNKEFFDYMLLTDESLSGTKCNNYINYLRQIEFEVKDTYLGLIHVGLDNEHTLRMCASLYFSLRKEVQEEELDKKMLTEIVVGATEFRLKHLETKGSYIAGVRKELIQTIKDSFSLDSLETNLRRVKKAKGIKLDNKSYYVDLGVYSVNSVGVNIKCLSEPSNKYIILKRKFDLIHNHTGAYKDLLGIGFIEKGNDMEYVLIDEDYQDNYLFDYVIA